MRRKALLSTSATPAQPQKSNIIKAIIRVSLDDADNEDYVLFGSDFDLSQISWVRISYSGEMVDIPLNGNTLPIRRAGDFEIEIGLNNLTNGDWMFTYTRLLECDFSDVDISQLASCQAMFSGTLITESPMRELSMPLSPYSCAGMFSYCENLVLAPVLSAKVVPYFCYTRLFYGCTNLRYIRLLATEIEETSLYDWLIDAPSIGTLVKDADATWESPYIPEEWTVITTEDELKPPSGLEYPIVLKYDYIDYDDNGAIVATREADEYSVNLYSFLQSALNEYGLSLMDGITFLTSQSITKELGLAIFIERVQCYSIIKSSDDAYIEIDCTGEYGNYSNALYEDGTMHKI